MSYNHEDLTLTRGDLSALQQLLTEQRVRRLDVVTGPGPLHYEGGQLRIDTGEVAVTDEGVDSIGGWYHPTATFETLLTRFGVPGGILRKWRDDNRIELVDFTVNHYLHGSQDDPQTNPPHDGNFMLRLFTADETGGGIARAILSDSYKPVDHLDVLVSALDGIKAAGVPVQIGRCDVSERFMYVAVECPQVKALAPTLLKGYRSPFTGLEAEKNPIVFAGFVITNSEFGQGAAKLTPRITVLACRNGMTFSQDAMKAVHLGSKREEGIIQYSAETQEKELELIQLKVRDAVSAFLQPAYVERKIRELERQAGVEIPHPEDTVRQVVSETGISQAHADEVLRNFIKGGQLTAGGVMQAVTATAQTLDDPEESYELESKAGVVLAAAARLA